MALIRTLLSLFLLLSLASAIGAIVLHSINRSRYNKDDSPGRFYDNTLHGFGLAGAAAGIIASALGLLLTWTRNLHRRPLTMVFLMWALPTLIVIGAAIGIWALYENAGTDLPGVSDAALATDAALAFFLALSVLTYIYKSMEEFAVGHK